MKSTKQEKKILNFKEIRKFLNQKFPNFMLETRMKQFTEILVSCYLKELVKKSCMLTKHRKSKIMQVRDIKINLMKNFGGLRDFSQFFEKLAFQKLTPK